MIETIFCQSVTKQNLNGFVSHVLFKRPWTLFPRNCFTDFPGINEICLNGNLVIVSHNEGWGPLKMGVLFIALLRTGNVAKLGSHWVKFLKSLRTKQLMRI